MSAKKTPARRRKGPPTAREMDREISGIYKAAESKYRDGESLSVFLARWEASDWKGFHRFRRLSHRRASTPRRLGADDRKRLAAADEANAAMMSEYNRRFHAAQAEHQAEERRKADRRQEQETRLFELAVAAGKIDVDEQVDWLVSKLSPHFQGNPAAACQAIKSTPGLCLEFLAAAQAEARNESAGDKQGGKPRQRRNVDERMKLTLLKAPEAVGWTITEWERELKCSRAAIQKTAMWKTLHAQHRLAKADAAMNKTPAKRRKQKPKPR